MAFVASSADDLADLQRSLGKPLSSRPEEQDTRSKDTTSPKEGLDEEDAKKGGREGAPQGIAPKPISENDPPQNTQTSEPNWLDWTVNVGDDLKRELAPILLRVSPADCTIVIDGESGSGKEIVAKTIHANSSRRYSPFIAFNCSAVPETLIESEIFGHERGAFTGSDKKTLGKFAAADGGTLFLDEIADMSWSVQTRLLRVLESGEIAVVGAPTSKFVDVRVIAASNQDLGRLVKEKKFREDLFWRLGVVKIYVPPLRERPADIVFLAKEFLKRCAPRQKGKPFFLSPGAEAVLRGYHWPGNVRQLREVVQAASIFATGPEISAENVSMFLLRSTSGLPAVSFVEIQREEAASPAMPILPVVAVASAPEIRNVETTNVDTTKSLEEVMRAAADDAAREYLLELLNECHWNGRMAAKRAGRSYKAMLNDVKRLGLNKLRPPRQ